MMTIPGVTSSRKGSKFERDIARDLSKWLGEEKTVFWRSASSGAAATQSKNKANASHYCGDLVSIAPVSQKFIDTFYVELKHRKDIEAHKVFTRNGFLWNTWLHTVEQAKDFNKLPLLIARQSRWETLVMICETGMWKLHVYPHVGYGYDMCGGAIIMSFKRFAEMMPPYRS